MVYMGSKNRIAKELIPIITKYLTKDRWYVEPFVGGANMIDKVRHDKRIANDYNKYLIALFKALQQGVEFPTYISKEEYDAVRTNKDNYEDWYVGFVGFVCSFRGKFFNGWCGNGCVRKNGKIENHQLDQIKNFTKQRNWQKEHKANISAQRTDIMGILFYNKKYNELYIPDNSVIYCDPPYQGTTAYKNESKFNHDEFWQWCRDMTSKGHDVLISEYNAPSEFVCVWQKGINMNLDGGKGRIATEKLFVHESIADKYMSNELKLF